MQNILLLETPKVVRKEGSRATIEIDGCSPGYGMTIGSAVRRVILSSLPGAAITAVKIKGVTHEFSTIPGVLEDVVTIMLNLKQIRIKLHAEGTIRVTLSVKGKRTVTAGDIVVGSEVEIVNPSQLIATLTSDESDLEMELEMERGMGYVPVEERRKEKLEIGLIALDAIFSPIRRVNFEVENMRVGDRTDYNRIRFDIETDSTMTPEEAFQKSVDILIQHFERLKELRHAAAESPVAEEKAPLETGRHEEEGPALATADALNQPIDELKLSTRGINILKEAGYKTVGDIAKHTEADMLTMGGLGDKALKDIKKALGRLGLTLPEKN